jgi:acetylglutamate kinase
MTEFLALDSGYKQLRKSFSSVSRWRGKIVVVKYGGAAMVNDFLKESFARDIVFLKGNGVKVVIVHGGGKEITATADKLGIPTKFINGQRYTDKAMMDVVQMVLAGKTNKDIVAEINRRGGNAVGLCGVDAGLLNVKKYDDGSEDLGLVGEITGVNSNVLRIFLNNALLPVIAPIGVDNNGAVYNINADVAAAAVAKELQAESLLFLSDVPGVMVNQVLVHRLSYEEATRMINEGSINNGMIPKIRSGFEALHAGVSAVHFIDGREEHAVLGQLCSNGSFGTALSFSSANAAKMASA